MTSLGYQDIWARLSEHDDVNVYRLFTDSHEVLPQTPALVGFSLGWELDYSNLLDLMHKTVSGSLSQALNLNLLDTQSSKII